MSKVRALIHAWLVLDFFGEARSTGGAGSTLTTTIFSQSFLAFVFAALLYPETPPVPFAAANLCLSSLLVAIGVLSDQEHRQRQRADRMLLGTAPIRASQLVAARAGHAAFYVGLVTIGMALPPAILLAFLRGNAVVIPAYVAAACACSALASAVLGVVLRALDRLVGPVRAALLAGTGKAALLAGGLVLFALGLRALDGTADNLPIGRVGAQLLPPYQLAKVLYDPAGELWRLGPLAAAAAALLLLRIALERGDAADTVRIGRIGPLTLLLRRLAGRGPRLAIAEFVAISMWRSAGFRSRVLPLLGLPAGMVFLTMRGGAEDPNLIFVSLLLQLPAIYLPFVIAFLPRAEQSDTEWIFAHGPGLPLALVRDATWRALVTHVLLPVHAVAMILAVSTSKAPLDTASAALFAAGLAVLASKPMLRALDAVPFSRGSEADGATDLGGLFTAAMLLGGAGTVFAAVLPGPGRWLVAGITVALAVLSLRRLPRPEGAQALAVQFGPAPTTAVQAMKPQRDRPEVAAPDATLGRELRAICVLYLAVSVVPALVGSMFAA
ncbi:MAG: hypothetical protein H6838_13535 [Planctomycetes bacterium]|nr:hypothetical protein [Planctomycetota bacterium]